MLKLTSVFYLCKRSKEFLLLRPDRKKGYRNPCLPRSKPFLLTNTAGSSPPSRFFLILNRCNALFCSYWSSKNLLKQKKETIFLTKNCQSIVFRGNDYSFTGSLISSYCHLSKQILTLTFPFHEFRAPEDN